MSSPYHNKPQEEWLDITNELIDRHPLSEAELVEATLDAWNGIFKCLISEEKFCIGKDIFPKPQIMGFFLHELISLKLIAKYPTLWANDKTAVEKDLVYKPDLKYSFEIKTSSSRNKIFGNRSYAQPTDNPKKDKSGYYLAVNFEKFSESENPSIKLIRFGWLDHTDWIGQNAPTGQQASLRPSAYQYKLVKLYSMKNQQLQI